MSWAAAGQPSMSMMVGWMGIMVRDGDSSKASSGDSGRPRNDGGGAAAADGLAVAEASREGGRGVGVDDAAVGTDLADGDRWTSATRALSVSLSSDS